MIEPRGLLRQAAGWYVARFPGERGALAMMLGPVWMGGGPVLAADTVVWTTASGQVLAAGQVGVDAQGAPVATSLGNWVLVRRGGREQEVLGSDLLDILGRDGALPERLLDGARPHVAVGEDRPQPTRDVSWAAVDAPQAV